MATTDVETITLRLPQEVLQILDSLVERQLFSSRSEAIREFCRDYLGAASSAHDAAAQAARRKADGEAR